MKPRLSSALLLAALLGMWAAPASTRGQLLATNGWVPLPTTRLESFETNTGAVILRATAPIGKVELNNVNLLVNCREITDSGAGRRAHGMQVIIDEVGQPEERALIDFDELEPLLVAMDYLNRIDWSATSLPGFDAVFTTKGGLRVAAFGSRSTGTIDFAVRQLRSGKPPVRLTREQMSQFKALLEQGKARLEALGAAK
jgi:hypothetical protein